MTTIERRLLVAAGGTGGHVFPAIAVAEEATQAGWQVLFVGGEGGMEEQLVRRQGYDMQVLPVGKWKRESLKRRLEAMSQAARKLARPRAARCVLDLCEELAGAEVGSGLAARRGR